MDDAPVRKLAAFAGLLAAATVFAVVPLFFMYAGPPPAWNVLTRDFVTLLTCAGLLIFVAGYAHVAARAEPSAQFAALLAVAAGSLYVGLTLVSISLEAGVVFGAPDGTLDPTIDGPLAHANMLTHGPIKRLLTAIYLFAAGYAALRARLLPAWLRWFGYAIALANLAFLPSLFFGTDPTQFYAVHSWANSAVTGSLIMWWVLAASVAMLLKRPAPG